MRKDGEIANTQALQGKIFVLRKGRAQGKEDHIVKGDGWKGSERRKKGSELDSQRVRVRSFARRSKKKVIFIKITPPTAT